MSYDLLDRLTSKAYSGPAQCDSTVDVGYTYDQSDPGNGQYGKGRRTGMSDGSGATAWQYDVRGRLVKETKTVSGAASATFVYDGDGKRVMGTVSGVTTTYIGNYFEWTGSTVTMKKYYYAGATRVAMRVGSALSWLLSDHLGSTAITANSGGGLSAELRYKAWGEKRYQENYSNSDWIWKLM